MKARFLILLILLYLRLTISSLDYGFSAFCPIQLQQTLIDKLDSWKDNATICETFWADRTTPFVMEMFRQSCQLPITFGPTLKKSLELFKYFLIVRYFT